MSGDAETARDPQKRMMVDLKRLSKSHYQIRVGVFFHPFFF